MRPTLAGLAIAMTATGCAGGSVARTATAGVAAPIVRSPPSPSGTVVLIHPGGWAGPNRAQQRQLSDFPGAELRRHGYRTVSLDYAAGKAGLASVVAQVGRAKRGRRGRLCLYGESAGGNLALLVAARDHRITCVMTLGAPTQFAAWRREAQRRAKDPRVDRQVAADRRAVALSVFEQTVLPAFGAPGPRTRAWEPARLASRVRATVELGAQRDDFVVPADQARLFARRAPHARTFTLPAGAPSDRYLHGTLGAAGRRQLVGRLLRLLRRSV